MATQFYFKREWLNNENIKGHPYSQYTGSLEFSAITKNDETGIYTIKSEFYLWHASSLNVLSKVLNELGFRVIKFKNFRVPGFCGTFVKILPFPYTDKRCRGKEL